MDGASSIPGLEYHLQNYRSCDEQSLLELDISCAKNSVNVLVAFGGGSVIDLCKLVARRRALHLVVVPTALSSDCIASPISVLATEKQARISVPAAMPNEIIIDVELLTSAPARLIKSGIGDLLSNASALIELKEKRGLGLDVNDFAILISEFSIGQFLADFSSLAEDPRSLTLELAKGLVLSGMAMGFSGDSSPCSGSEHLISHAIDLFPSEQLLHGEQVGLAVVFVNQLRAYLGMTEIPEGVIRTLKDFCGFRNPEHFDISKNSFLRAVMGAASVRQGRLPFWSNSGLDRSDFELVFERAFH